MTEFIALHRMGQMWNLSLIEDAETTDEAIRIAESYMSQRDLAEVTEIRSIPVSAMVETVRSEVA